MRQTSGTMHAVSPIGHEGFVVVKELTSPSRLDALRKAALRRMALPFDESCVRPHNTLVPLRWNDESVRISLSAPGLIDRIRTALSATDLRWISGYLSVKEPSSGPLWWHQDWWAWDHPATFEPGCPQAAVLIYLTATSTDNGALRIIPGSHHRSHPLHAHLPEPPSAEISGTQDTLPGTDRIDGAVLKAFKHCINILP